MPFHFNRNESEARAARRLCRDRIRAALAGLKGRNRPAAVHDVRREIKKLRAILRLVRGGISGGDYRKNMEALREAANHLTAPRDARVKLKALQALRRRFKGRRSAPAFAGIEAVLRENCREKTRRFLKGDSIVRAERVLRKVKRRLDGLKIQTDGWALIQPGLKESYRRGQKAREAILDEPSPENFHEWRKRVKDLWYQLRLLGPASPEAQRAAVDTLEASGKILGDDHDLALLKQFVGGKRAGEAERLDELIGLRQKELRAAALKRGSRLYSEKPAVFCGRIEKHWKARRGKSGK